MAAAAALVILGVLMVVLGLFVTGGSVGLIGLGVVSLIAAGVLQVMQSRRQ